MYATLMIIRGMKYWTRQSMFLYLKQESCLNNFKIGDSGFPSPLEIFCWHPDGNVHREALGTERLIHLTKENSSDIPYKPSKTTQRVP